MQRMFIFWTVTPGVNRRWIKNWIDLEINGVTGYLKYAIPRVVIFNWSDLICERNEFLQTCHFYFDDGWEWIWTLSCCNQTSIRPTSISNIWDRFKNSTILPAGSTSAYSKLGGSKSNIITGHCQHWNKTGIEESLWQEEEAIGWCLGGSRV